MSLAAETQCSIQQQHETCTTFHFDNSTHSVVSRVSGITYTMYPDIKGIIPTVLEEPLFYTGKYIDHKQFILDGQGIACNKKGFFKIHLMSG